VRIIQPEMKTGAQSPRRPTGPMIPADEGLRGRVSRRHFLAATAAAGAAGAGLSGWAFGPAATTVELTRHDALVPGLAPGLDGLRIAQVSDVHLPANAGAVRNALALLDAERPEIVLLTGDIVEHYDALDDLIAFAGRKKWRRQVARAAAAAARQVTDDWTTFATAYDAGLCQPAPPLE